MDELAKKLINDHRNPIVKVDLAGSKLLLKSSTVEETKFIEKHQNNLESLLRHERAERRCGRSQAIWVSDTNLAKVTKVVKTLLNHFGYQVKSGIFLYPEETLFLMETNRLEVFHNDVPLSIQEGYSLICSNECNLIKYRVYKKLVLLGYKLLRYSEVLRRQSKHKRQTGKDTINSMVGSEEQPTVKRCLEECELPKESKKMCIGKGIENCEEELITETDVGSGSGHKNKEFQHKLINDLFKNLRQTAPRGYKSNTTDNQVPDFCVFLPHNKSRCDFDFNLYVCKEPILQKKLPHKSIPTIYAICSDDKISFYRYAEVNLPYL